MADIRRVTKDFAVAPQVSPDDLAEIARQGFRLVINTRPDGEAAGQPSSAAIAQAAREARLAYVHIPIHGAPQVGQVEAMRVALQGANGPALAFCRSGMRSIATWALGEAAHGRPPQTLIEVARAAGYDLSGLLA